MNYKMIARFYALILGIEAVFMLPALAISYYDGTERTTNAYLMTLAAMAVVILFLSVFSIRSERGFYVKEGLVCVGSGWVLLSLFGCLPFFLSGEIPHFIDALFEIVSGFTTTGSSILSNPEELTRAALYWRSFSHWLGGMGVLVFLLAIVPVGNGDEGFTMHLLRAESPGPSVGKLVPKMKQTAKVLYLVYVALTVINFALLMLGGVNWFESICTAFGTAGTGGFGLKSDSMGGYNSYVQVVTTIFMLLFGVNFSCYYLILLKQVRAVLKDEELRLYFGLVVGSIVLISINLIGVYSNIFETVKHASFQVASVITTTGFSTVDFDLWPSFSKAILMILMMVGACAGSTGGGLKCIRLLLLFKSIRRTIEQVLRPNRVKVVRVNEKTMDEKLIANTNAYFAVYVMLMIVSFFIISLDGFSVLTNFTAVLSAVNNIGPGLEAVGPMCNFGGYSVLSKIVLIFDMLAGRLEIFPILMLFNFHAWKKH